MGSVDIFRCRECRTLATNRLICRRGVRGCPKCGGREFVGASTYTWWEWVLIQLGVR